MVGRLLRALLGTLTVVVALATAIAGLLIVLPPYGGEAGWQATLVLTEWSLLIVLPAVVALLLAAFTRWAGMRKTAVMGTILALLAVALAAVPAVRGGVDTAEHGVRFDPFDYLTGSATTSAGRPDETAVYTRPGGMPLRLDVWQPGEQRSGSGSRPAVIYVHGGRWVEGRRSELPRWDSWLGTQGFVVFDIDYRLARPGAPTWQLAPGDVKCAVGWVRANAERYGVNPDRVVLMGEAAGGQLAMLAANAGAELPSTCPELGGNGRAAVDSVIAMYAPAVLTAGYHRARPWWHDNALWEAGRERMRTYLGGPPAQQPEAYRVSEPFRHIDRDSPPTLLIHGGRDLLVPPGDSRTMDSALEAAGVQHQLIEIGYADHRFDLNWGGFAAQIARHHITRFLGARAS